MLQRANLEKDKGVQVSVVSSRDLATFDSVRSYIDTLLTFWSHPDKPTIQIIDVAGFSTLKLTLFLKVLEMEGGFKFWFFGLPLTSFPKTFTSRCVVLRDRTALVAHISGEVLAERDVFMDFLYNLEAFKSENFNNLYVFLQKANENWVELLKLFLDNSPIFTAAHLKVCPFLREPDIQTYIRGSREINFRFIFLWLMTRKVVGR